MADSMRPKQPTQESMLLDLVERLERHRAGRIAVHIHLSDLSRAYARESYIRIATESFASYAIGFEGQLFALENGDLFFVARDITRTILQTAVDRLKQLFTQDPLLQNQDVRGMRSFCTFYDLIDDYDDLLADARDLLRRAEKRRAQESSPLYEPYKKAQAISPDILSKVENALGNVDVTNITRRQSVCTLLDLKTPQPLFEEIFISIGDLQNAIAPGFDLGANTWLFRYLTQTLDRRLMLMLIRDGVSNARPFSLNLNVATVLTPEFAKFETIITPQLRGRLVIEMNKIDVLADLGSFLFARDYLHDHGFRLCLDGLTQHSFPYFSRSKLGFDLVKLYWAPDALDVLLPGMLPEMRSLVMDTGQAHTILCRCEEEQAIAIGQDLGIVMFQGRHVDRLLSAARGAPQPVSKLNV